MSARILGCLSASLLLGACASTPGYHSDRGGDYYYGTTTADVVIDTLPRHSAWGFGGGYAWGGYGGYYSPWAWHGGYGYSPWWWYGHGPLVVDPHAVRRSVPRDVLRYRPGSNVRAERPQAAPGHIESPAAPRALHAAPRPDTRARQPMLPSSRFAPGPRVAPRPAAGAAPRRAPVSGAPPAPNRAPAVSPRPAPVFRSAPSEQRVPSAPRSSGKQRSDRR